MRHASLILLVGLVLGAPLPYGSVTPSAALAAVVVVAIAALALALDGRALATLQPLRTPVVALAGIGVLGFVQSSAWLGPWLGFLARGIGSHLPPELAAEVPRTLSLAPELSRQAAVGWWTVALLLVVSFAAGRESRARAALFGAFLVSLAFQSLYGLRQLRLAPSEIWGRAVTGPPRLRGTLVNSDHFAVYLEIALAVCVGWWWWAWRVSRREPRLERRLLLLAPPPLLAALCFLGIVGTGSRAGLAAAVLAIAVQAGFIFGPRRRWWIPAALLAAVAITGAVQLSRGPVDGMGRQLSRPFYEIVSSERFAVWGPALRLWRSSPWVGTGLGTFEEAFPRVQPARLQDARWGRAHNDPLELLVTGGLIGAGLLLGGLTLVIRRLWRVYRSGTETTSRAAALAALAALPPVAMHELFDFGLTVPANAILMTILIGAGASGPTAVEAGVAPLPPERRPRPRS